MPTKLVNGQAVELTQAEIDARAAEEAAWAAGEFDRKIEDVRTKRDRLIAETDYLVLSDYPTPASQAMLDYRQDLRDITNGVTTVAHIDAIVWPTKP